jgi:hypothetical protein
MSTSDLIQLAAALAAVAASIVALVIATLDRRTQLRIAREARDHSRLALELEYAVRLSANVNMGGSTDDAERKRLGAEALALAGVVGPRWVPRQYGRAMNYRSPEQLAERLADQDAVRTPRWVKDKIEAGLAVQAIVDAMYGPDERAVAVAPVADDADFVDDGWADPPAGVPTSPRRDQE